MADLHLGTKANNRRFTVPLDAVTESWGILAIKGAGKRLALDTPLPTPTGWTTMGEVQEGDLLLDDVGRPCRVTYLSPIVMGDARRVAFSDGSEIVADAEHLWLTWDASARRSEEQRARRGDVPEGRGDRPQCQRRCYPQVRSTAEIEATLMVLGRKNPERNHSIRNALPLDLPEADLEIDPYVLGAWLGDGSSHTGNITVGFGDEATVERIRSAGFEVVRHERELRVGSYCIRGLRTQLRHLGLLHNKYIPQHYLRASAEQRLALLQGLMDTDGGWSGSQVEIAVTNERLAEGIYELVVSLGMKASWTKRPAKLYGVEHGVSYRVRFSPTMQAFSLPRKAERWRTDVGQQRRRVHRYITEVSPYPSVPMRCITVDSPTHLYLAGRAMVPTHNTYTAKVLVEELALNLQPVCVIDPIGVWWGLRSSASGTESGHEFVILGGDHADAPLDPLSGSVVADFVVDEPSWVILDLSHMRKGEQRRFVTDFAERLYHRNRDPLMLVVDEADLFAPQDKGGDTARMRGAMEDLVRRGRAKGIGSILITQRPASINKDVLTQVSTLVCLRMSGKQDRDAIEAWVAANGSKDERDMMMGDLASLPTGTGYVWSPHFLQVFEKVSFRALRTFDSSATPRAGKKKVEPRARADVNLEALTERMGAAIEQAKLNDPKTLKRLAAELDREVAKLREQVANPAVRVETVEVPILPTGWKSAMDAVLEVADQIEEFSGKWVQMLRDTISEIDREARSDLQKSREDARRSVPTTTYKESKTPVGRTTAQQTAQPTRVPPPRPTGTTDSPDGVLTKGANGLLRTLVSRYPTRLTRSQLATLSKRSIRSSSFAPHVLEVVRAGFAVEDTVGIQATQAGLDLIGHVPPEDPLEGWMTALPSNARKLLAALIESDFATQAEWGEAAGISPTSSGLGGGITILRRNGLVDEDGGLFSLPEHLR